MPLVYLYTFPEQCSPGYGSKVVMFSLVFTWLERGHCYRACLDTTPWPCYRADLFQCGAVLPDPEHLINQILHLLAVSELMSWLKFLPTMGSYGDAWLHCTWCRRSGKCLLDMPEDVTPLTDIDGIGVLCDPCCHRGCPPHYEYLERLLEPKLGAVAEIAERIINFTYVVCAARPQYC